MRIQMRIRKRHRVPSSGGFTILEALIAITVFSMISIATVKQVQLVQNTKDSALKELDVYNQTRAALSMLRSDLSQAFHILYDDLGEETRSLLFQGNQQVPHTLFDGRKKELIFTSLSHRVYYRNSKESEQTEVSYFLQSDPKSKTFKWMKRESGFIDNDLFQGGQIYTLLDNVVSVELAYWNELTLKWVDDWNSDNGDTRDRFPLAVRLKIVVVDSQKREVPIQTIIKIANPNNSGFLVTL